MPITELPEDVQKTLELATNVIKFCRANSINPREISAALAMAAAASVGVITLVGGARKGALKSEIEHDKLLKEIEFQGVAVAAIVATTIKSLTSRAPLFSSFFQNVEKALFLPATPESAN